MLSTFPSSPGTYRFIMWDTILNKVSEIVSWPYILYSYFPQHIFTFSYPNMGRFHIKRGSKKVAGL